MIAVVQKVLHSKVTVDDEVVGEIKEGFNVLVGVSMDDDVADVEYIARKLVGLRVFEDAEGKLNLSIKDVGGSMLLVSQFTLLADVKKGKRPSFINAAKPEKAELLFNKLVELVERDVPVETGRFRTHMLVEIQNDGPVTILIDSKK